MTAITIRFATPADAPELARMRYAFRSSTGVATEPQSEFQERCASWMAEHLKDSQLWQCWVVVSQNRLIGALWLQLVEKIPNPRDEPEFHAYITNFYLEESARGQGLGTRVLTAAIDWCKAREVHAIILWPSDKSRSLYERHGFAVRPDILELILDKS